jgi:hypothetical protein
MTDNFSTLCVHDVMTFIALIKDTYYQQMTKYNNNNFIIGTLIYSVKPTNLDVG